MVDNGFGGYKKVPERIMKVSHDKYGYLHLTLSVGGKTQQVDVHRLVALAFLGFPPPGHVVCHGPAGRVCNELGNLSYGTPSKNCREDRRRDGTALLGEQVPNSKLTAKDVQFIRVSSESSNALGIKLGVSGRAVRKVRTGETWAHIE